MKSENMRDHGSSHPDMLSDIGFLTKLNAYYEHINMRYRQMFCAFMDNGLKFDSEFGIEHYFLGKNEHYESAEFPLPTFRFGSDCDVVVNLCSTDFYIYRDDIEITVSGLEEFFVQEYVLLHSNRDIHVVSFSSEIACAEIIRFSKHLQEILSII